MAGGIRGITVEIGGDTTKLGKALEGVNKKSKSLQSELKGVNKLLKHDPSNTTLLAQKQELLTKAISETKNKLETLKIAQEQAQAQFERGEITEEQYRDLQREIIATEQKLEGLTDELKEFGSVGAQKVAQVGEKMQDVGGKIEEFGKGFSVISAGAGAVLAGSVAAFVELDEGYDTIITKTGATGEALEGLNQVADNIFGSMPVEMATVGVAVGEINTRFGYTGEQLEKLSTQFIQFAEINGVDLNNSIGTVDKVLEQFNMDASEAGDVLDLITLKAQQTGIGADTLMSLIQQNGATFKDMGLGVKEAVVLLSQFEANGVNVETAMKGLKKATVEYAKEGISMEQGLSKTIEKIKSAKTETEALAEVEKLFGAKGANEMVKAIRENRLSVEDLTTAMGEYGNVVSDTFTATLDPIDQGKVAMNNLKLAGSQLAGVLQLTFAPMLTKIVEKIKSLTQGFAKLSPSMQKSIVIALSVTTVLGPLIIGIGKIVSLIGQILTFAPAIKTFITSLNLTLSASPWGAIATAIGLVVAGLIVYNSTTKDSQTETEIMCDKMDEFNAKLSENAQAYKDSKNARAEAMQGTEHEYGYYQQLATELSNITDENGRVIQGYETRAQTITGILSDALGQEITTDQLVAQGKQAIIDKINNLILTKKAEIQLSANEQAYAEAIQNSTTAVNTYMTAKANAKKVDDELAIAKQELNRVEAENAYLLERGTDAAIATYNNNVAEARAKVDELTQQQKENNKAVTDAERVYLGYQTTIQNYEALSSAIIEGDSAKINTAINNLVNNFISAENGTKASLAAQVTNAQTMLANLKLAFSEGAPGVTQEMVNNAQDLVDRATAEYNKLIGAGSNAGASSGQAVAYGVNSKAGTAQSAGQNVANSAKAGAESVDATSAGDKFGNGLVNALNAKQGPVRIAGVSLGNQAKSGMDSVDASSSGSNFGQGFINGMNSKSGSIWTSAWNLAKNALSALRAGIQEGSPSRLTKKSGGFFGEGFEIGIKDSISGVLRSVNLLVSDTKDAFLGKNGFDIHSPSRFMEDEVGKQIVAGLISGVDKDKNNAKKSAQELAKLYISETENTIKKRKDWHEIAIGDEIFLWEQLLTKCTKGSDEYKDIELKIIDAHKRYIDEERKNNNVSLKDEVNYWSELVKKCESGSVSYKLALAKYDEAVDSYEKSRLSELDSYIKQKQEFKEIEVNDEIKLWKDLLSELEKGSDEYKKAELKLFETYEQFVDEKRGTNEMSVQDEMAYWLNMSATCEEGSLLYKSIRQRYGQAVKEYDDTFVESHEEHVEELKNSNSMSLNDEVEYWKKLLKSGNYHVKNYSKILDKLKSAKVELTTKMKELDEEYSASVRDVKDNLIRDIQAVTDEYDRAVSDRKRSIVSSMGLFDAFRADSDIDKYTLTENLESQVEGLKEWDDVLTDLSKRKGLKGSDLLVDLQEMGVGSVETLKQINSMSDEELQRYINLYNEKNRIATERAIAESEALKAESDEQIRQLTIEANRQLDELEITYVANLEELGVTTADKSRRIGRDIVAGLKSGIEAETPVFQEYLTGFFNGIVSTAQSALRIHSPSRKFADLVGKQIPAGIALGIAQNSGIANKAVRDMSNDLTREASILNGATITRKLNTTFSATLGNGRTLADVMETMIDCSNKIYDRLNRLQIVLDSGTLVGETIDKIDAGLANRQILTARGL